MGSRELTASWCAGMGSDRQNIGAKPSPLITLFHGSGLQCETIFKFARFSDENNRSEPCLRAKSGCFFVSWVKNSATICLAVTLYLKPGTIRIDYKYKIWGSSAESYIMSDPIPRETGRLPQSDVCNK